MGIAEEYRDKLHIDYSRIQEMLATQATRHQWIVDQAAEVDRAYSELKNKLDVVKAQAYKRLKATQENGKPITEKAAEKYLPAEPDVVAANKAVVDAKYEASILSGAVTSFQQRKTMLQKIAEREVLTFYGDPEKGLNKPIKALRGTEANKFATDSQDVLLAEMGEDLLETV